MATVLRYTYIASLVSCMLNVQGFEGEFDDFEAGRIIVSTTAVMVISHHFGFLTFIVERASLNLWTSFRQETCRHSRKQ